MSQTKNPQIENLAADVREQFEGLCSHWMGRHVRTHDNFGRLIVSRDFWIGKSDAMYAEATYVAGLNKRLDA